MSTFLTNFCMIAAALTVIAMCGIVVVEFKHKPREEQIEHLREWLVWAVTLAERELGGGTGQLKLRYVYDMFIERFPWLAKIIGFEWFGDLVDDALEEMRTMLAGNKAIKAIVDGESE